MPDSAARFKTSTKNDGDIRTDHSRIDVLATQILGRLGDRSKKRAYVFTHRPLRSDRWVAQLLLFIFCFFIPPWSFTDVDRRGLDLPPCTIIQLFELYAGANQNGSYVVQVSPWAVELGFGPTRIQVHARVG